MILVEYTYNKYDSGKTKKVKIFNGKRKQAESIKFLTKLNELKVQLIWRNICQSGTCKLDKSKQWPYKVRNKTQVEKYLHSGLVPYSLSIQISHIND